MQLHKKNKPSNINRSIHLNRAQNVDIITVYTLLNRAQNNDDLAQSRVGVVILTTNFLKALLQLHITVHKDTIVIILGDTDKMQ